MYLQTFNKGPSDSLDYTIDWSAWLAADTITASTWNGGGLGVVSQTFTATTATVWVHGGDLGTSWIVTNTITTAYGRTVTRSIQIVIAV